MTDPIAVFEGHSDEIRSLSWSSDGVRLASGSTDGTVRIRDATTGASLPVLEGHGQSVTSVTWSPDGLRITSSGFDGTVRLWDATHGDLLQTKTVGRSHKGVVDWSPDGTRIASIVNENLRIWDAHLDRLIDRFQIVNCSFNQFRWAPDSRRFAVIGDWEQFEPARDRPIQLWDTETAPTFDRFTQDVGGGDAISLDWSADGSRIVAAWDSNTVEIWRVADGALEAKISVLSTDQDDFDFDPWDAEHAVLSWCPHSNRVVSCGPYEDVKVWDASSGARQIEIEQRVASAAAWSPNGRHLAIGGLGGIVEVWDAGIGDAPMI